MKHWALHKNICAEYKRAAEHCKATQAKHGGPDFIKLFQKWREVEKRSRALSDMAQSLIPYSQHATHAMGVEVEYDEVAAIQGTNAFRVTACFSEPIALIHPSVQQAVANSKVGLVMTSREHSVVVLINCENGPDGSSMRISPFVMANNCPLGVMTPEKFLKQMND